MDNKIANYWERFGIAVSGFLIAMCAWMYLQHNERINSLEVKVQSLQVEKVNRQELKEMEERMNKGISSVKEDVRSMETNIIGRLDWYLTGRRAAKDREQ